MTATIVSVHVKVRDRGNYTFKDETGNVVANLEEEYVPSFFPEDHYGDYLIFDIDLKTGRILNWVPPSDQQIKNITKREKANE